MTGFDILIRLKSPPDIPGVREILTTAFDGSAEADLVERLRENGRVVLSLVAEVADERVGHFMFTDVAIDGHPQAHWVGLAPLAVRPDRQGQGVGAALVRRGLEDLNLFGHHGVVVLDEPKYYSRFGFQAANRFGLVCTYDAPPEAFMALALGGSTIPDGTVHYAKEFDVFG